MRARAVHVHGRNGFPPYHLQPLFHGGRPLQVFGRRRDVPILGLLAEVDHMAGEQGLAMILEVGLVRIHQAVQPGQEFLRAVIGVEHHRDLVRRRDGSDVVRPGDPSRDRRLLLVVGHRLTGAVST